MLYQKAWFLNRKTHYLVSRHLTISSISALQDLAKHETLWQGSSDNRENMYNTGQSVLRHGCDISCISCSPAVIEKKIYLYYPHKPWIYESKVTKSWPVTCDNVILAEIIKDLIFKKYIRNSSQISWSTRNSHISKCFKNDNYSNWRQQNRKPLKEVNEIM